MKINTPQYFLYFLINKSKFKNKIKIGNKTIIDNLYKAFAIGDVPNVLGSMDEKIVWNEAEGNAYTDGKIIAFQQYVDTKKLADAMG